MSIASRNRNIGLGVLGAAAAVGAGLAIASAYADKPKNGTGALNQSLFYTIDPSKWYTVFPYAFEIRDGKGAALYRFFLPIPPQSMTTQQMSTSEAHATIGGVVEETSAPVFQSITLVGTTGMSLRSDSVTGSAADTDLNLKQRDDFGELTGESGILGRLRSNLGSALIGNTLGALEQEHPLPFEGFGSAVNSSKKFVTGMRGAQSESAGFLSKILGQKPEKRTTPFANGFSWSHALRQFFLVYAREHSVNPDWGLYFIDNKAGFQVRCVPRSVQFQQTAQSPFTQQYNIVLKCWHLKTSDSSNIKRLDRFAKGGDLANVETASLTGAVSKLKNVAKNFMRPGGVAGAFTKNTLGSVV